MNEEIVKRLDAIDERLTSIEKIMEDTAQVVSGAAEQVHPVLESIQNHPMLKMLFVDRSKNGKR